MPRPNTEKNFNPAYSTVKSLFLQSTYNSEKVNILKQNTECQFERLELVENINDVFPNGVVIVRDTKDIVGRLRQYKIDKVVIEFLNGTVWKCDITSVSYINNAASDTEENYVGIYISNEYYQKVQKTSLNHTLGFFKPNVFIIEDFVKLLGKKCFARSDEELAKTVDQTDNYVLYKPLNTVDERIEAVSDNPIEYLNYLSTGAIGMPEDGHTYGAPNFMFWTNFDGSINFKYFYRNPEDDPNAEKVDTDFRRIGIYDGDSVIQKLSDGKIYRKAYFYTTNPAYQFISKNYYYIKKTPKVLDSYPANLAAAGREEDLQKYHYKGLAYQFQDEGEKFNIEIVDSEGTGKAVPGADQLTCTSHWGYFDGLDSINGRSQHYLIGQNFGTQTSFSQLNLMGLSGYMPFVDNTEMWKNMFDFTEVHPDYPDTTDFVSNIKGENTNLQKVMNIRYEVFRLNSTGADERLAQARQIELQNFIMYSLCCMGTRGNEDCFFAALTRWELDNGITGVTAAIMSAKKYRYAWNKLSFLGPSGWSGPTGYGPPPGWTSLGTGMTSFYKIENWYFDPTIRSGFTQDDTWAINLNERGGNIGYLAPGYVAECLPGGFEFRPIGAKIYPSTGLSGDFTFHIVKMCRHQEAGFNVYYFTAENAIDGCCPTGVTI